MDFRRLFDIFPYQLAKYPQKVALAIRNGLHWETYSTEDCLQIIESLSTGLLDLGLKRGDKMGLMSHTGNPQWNFLDMAMQQLGVVVVPIHASINPEDLEYILNDASVKYCVVDDRELYEKVNAAKGNAKKLIGIFTLKKLPDVPHWEKLKKAPTDKHLETFQALKAGIHEDDLATIIYTSGTTSKPKGVMLSHKNIVTNIKATLSLSPVNCDKKTFSFLPLSHIFERMVTYTYIAAGASLYYNESKEMIMENIKEIRPHYFTTIPRFLEKVHDGLLETATNKSKMQRFIIHWAVNLGKRYKGNKGMALGYWFKLILADILVFRKWRRSLGGKIEGVAVGAASLRPDLGRLFSAAGVEIREGYGLTETSPVVAFNRFEPGGVRFGTVGIPIPGTEIQIADPNENGEGEILVKGPNVMLGYYHDEERTKAAFTTDGWFKTGDIGKIVHKRFLKITDRKKDIFKTSSGKFVSPQKIENHLKNSPYIEEVVIIGFKRPYVTAIIYPFYPLLQQWCKDTQVHWTAPQYMAINPKVRAMIQQEINQLNEELLSHEVVRGFHLLHEPFSEEKGEVTTTLKVKRPMVLANYEKEINEMYQKG